MSKTVNKKWNDLGTRLLSAVVMIVLGVGAVIYGGTLFHVLTACVCGVMVWEMCRLVTPEKSALPVQGGLLQAAAIFAAVQLSAPWVLPVLLAPALAIGLQIRGYRTLVSVFMVAIALAGYEMLHLRDDLGFVWLVWLVALVVVTDVAGYFFGRLIGGPKFWPALSPKKTWAGTAGGWLCAAAVGVWFVTGQGLDWWMIPFSVTVAMASQAGDLAESALKRYAGAKDSSSLIPGHGGLMDRFDGMAGASLYVMVMVNIFGLQLVSG
jgi:phosphatidate cytidylyltransferase